VDSGVPRPTCYWAQAATHIQRQRQIPHEEKTLSRGEKHLTVSAAKEPPVKNLFTSVLEAQCHARVKGTKEDDDANGSDDEHLSWRGRHIYVLKKEPSETSLHKVAHQLRLY
jgi:hypothetical protein